MYSTAVSRKKKYTKSPFVMELTKFGAVKLETSNKKETRMLEHFSGVLPTNGGFMAYVIHLDETNEYFHIVADICFLENIINWNFRHLWIKCITKRWNKQMQIEQSKVIYIIEAGQSTLITYHSSLNYRIAPFVMARDRWSDRFRWNRPPCPNIVHYLQKEIVEKRKKELFELNSFRFHALWIAEILSEFRLISEELSFRLLAHNMFAYPKLTRYPRQSSATKFAAS